MELIHKESWLKKYDWLLPTFIKILWFLRQETFLESFKTKGKNNESFICTFTQQTTK